MTDVKGPGRFSNAAFSNPGAAALTVRAGEGSLADVARRIGVSLEALAHANPEIAKLTDLKPGQEIRLPQSGQGAPASDPEASAPAAAPGLPAADPLARSLVQARFNRDHSPAPAIPAGVMMYAQDGGIGAGAAPAKAGPAVSGDIASLLAEGAKVKGAKEEFTGAQQAIAAGDFAKAYAHLEKLMRKQGEDVLSDDMVKGAQTVRDQLEFLAGMQKAGIKADYPPTEKQLTDYFRTLKDDPAAARKAFGDYASLFHVHPANTNRAGHDIQYSKDDNKYGTRVPDNWSEVSNRSSGDKGQHVGKQLNDCEGFAFMADKLLSAAGFRVQHHIAAFPGPDGEGHSMVSFTHPKEKGFTVASNNVVVRGATEKAAAQAGLKSAMSEATGKESFFTGASMAEAQIQQVLKDKKL